MELIESFKGKPVMILLRDPILSAISAEEVDLGEEGKCGSATMAFMQQKPNEQPQPVMLQVLRGSIDEFDETSVMINVKGADNKTGLRILVERKDVKAIYFAIEHFAQAAPTPAPQIIAH